MEPNQPKEWPKVNRKLDVYRSGQKMRADRGILEQYVRMLGSDCLKTLPAENYAPGRMKTGLPKG